MPEKLIFKINLNKVFTFGVETETKSNTNTNEQSVENYNCKLLHADYYEKDLVGHGSLKSLVSNVSINSEDLNNFELEDDIANLNEDDF